MKITQVTPGLLAIPPNGWGAVEKIIWNYKLKFDSMGHNCDIQYLNDVDVNSDIVHIHVANLALEAKQRGIPYIFSLHDHHVVRHGKDSKSYQINLDAIKGSIISFTHAEFLVDYFDETDKLFYLTHGVDVDLFSPTEKNITEHKLLCVANNGYGDNPAYDRKGFRYAIEAAKELDLPITIVGPPNNMRFFDANSDLLEYEKLTLLTHNATEEELLDIFRSHTIFIHPSELEAGHPNLTLLESISSGVPVVGTYNGTHEIKSLYKIERNTNSVKKGIEHVIENYENYLNNINIDREHYSWDKVCERMIKMYDTVKIIQKEYNSPITKQRYIDVIESTKINHIQPKENLEIIVNFVDGVYVEVRNNISSDYFVEFFDSNDTMVYSTTIKNNMWTKPNKRYYQDWRVKITRDNQVIFNEKINLDGHRVYIAIDSSALGDNLSWMPYIDEFRKKHKCQMICSTFKNDLFKSMYPEIEFVEPGIPVGNIIAMYKLGWFYNLDMEPTLPNVVSLQEHACNILGLEYTEIRPKMSFVPSSRPIKDKYVTIGTTTTSGCKEWSNPDGWQTLIDYLNDIGYKVAVINKEAVPHLKNVLDWTGDKPLEERMNQMHHSEFYVGLGSGLSWLAWSVNKHVVMISNFSLENHEFVTNVTRIVNKSVCNGCWNNPNYKFDRGDWYWCPVFKGTERQFECHKSITAEMVIDQIQPLLK